MAKEKTKSETLLIVDDDVRVVELLQITLGGRGYEVTTAYDGDAALQMIESQQPDLVVLDVRLPRKGGFEVLSTIREQEATRHLPVVLISANAATESRLQGLKLGADDYITKPFSPRELILRIRRILDRTKDRNLLLLKNEVLETEVRRGRNTLVEMQSDLSQNLQRIGGLITRVLDLNQTAPIEEVLERFVVTAVGGLDFGRIALLTCNDSGDLDPRVWRGVPESAIRGLRFPSDGFLVGVLKTIARPMRLEEFEDYPEAQDEMGLLSAAGMTLVVPAFCGSDLKGMLGLGERDRSRQIGRYEMTVLEILGHSIATALRNAEAFDASQRTFLETTARLVASIEGRYPFMTGHSQRVCELSLGLGKRLGLPDEELEVLRYGALLHGLGELDRFPELMESSKVLTDDERRKMRRESAEQTDALLGPRSRDRVRQILKYHHEYWDGTGFPDKLRGVDIPMGARIVSVTNAWDALNHDRPHRPAYSHEEASRILQDRTGVQFDPDLVPLLIELVESESPRVLSA